MKTLYLGELHGVKIYLRPVGATYDLVLQGGTDTARNSVYEYMKWTIEQASKVMEKPKTECVK